MRLPVFHPWQHRRLSSLTVAAALGLLSSAAVAQTYPGPTIALGTQPVYPTCKSSDFTLSTTLAYNHVKEGQWSTLYRSTFDLSNRTGDVLAYDFTRDAVGTDAVRLRLSTQTWSAAESLNRTNPNDRNIVMGTRKSDNTFGSVDFTWLSVNATAMGTALKGTDGRGKERLEYLRGDRTWETTTDATKRLRPRTSLLGDILNSGLTYSGLPSTSIRDADYYRSALFTNRRDRNPVVFVGANDGMLHAFNADNNNGNGGKELFAYIPSWFSSKLPKLTANSYNTLPNPAQLFVDATPAVAEAWVGQDRTQGDSSAQGEWKTVLIGGSGGGGRGVYALDVSDPTQFDKSKVLWEFSSLDDKFLGNVTAKPKIVKINTSSKAHNWFALVPSGINNYTTQDGGSQRLYSAQQVILVLALNKTQGTKWRPSGNYHIIRFPVPDQHRNIPAGIVDFNLVTDPKTGALQQIYAGDLHGKVWRLDFSNKSLPTAITDINRELALNKPLFIAKDENGNPQPITTAPSIQRLNANANIIAFGTGKYMEQRDNDDRGQQTFYAIVDSATGHKNASGQPVTITREQHLKAIDSDGDANTQTLSLNDFLWTSNLNAINKFDPQNKNYAGWYFDFPNTGERFVSNTAAKGSALRFNTIVPQKIATNSTSCGVGYSRAYSVNLRTGAGKIRKVSDALLGEPLVFHSISTSDPGTTNSLGQSTAAVFYDELAFSPSQNRMAGQVDSTIMETLEVTEQITSDSFLNWRKIHNYQRIYRDAN